MSNYDVGAPPPRRRRTEGSSGGVSPLIAASRPPVAPESLVEPEQQQIFETEAPPVLDTAVAAGVLEDAALQAVPTPAPAQDVWTPSGGVASPAPVSDSAELPLRKKTIAFPIDLWRYAGAVHNATDEEEGEMYFQEFVWAAVRREIERREIKYNDGQPFDSSSRLRRGRRRQVD